MGNAWGQALFRIRRRELNLNLGRRFGWLGLADRRRWLMLRPEAHHFARTAVLIFQNDQTEQSEHRNGDQQKEDKVHWNGHPFKYRLDSDRVQSIATEGSEQGTCHPTCPEQNEHKFNIN